MALESRTATLPVDEPDGVYIRSTRLVVAEFEKKNRQLRRLETTDWLTDSLSYGLNESTSTPRLSNAEGQDVYFHIRQCSGSVLI